MSSREHMNDPQHLHIPFSVPNRQTCSATISIKPDPDPILHGKGLIDLYDDANVTKGYPLLHATVSSPESLTYGALYGWVQITNTPGEDWVMDTYPLFHDVNSPFTFWGAEPTAVDAPGRQDVKDYDWTARTFLCYSPDACMTKTVRPILGFEWGFWIDDYKPYVKRLERLDVKCWDEHLGLFRGKYEGWTFEEASR